MRKLISVLCAAALITVTSGLPVRAADDAATARAYFKISFGGDDSRPVADRSSFGFRFDYEPGRELNETLQTQMDFSALQNDWRQAERPALVDLSFGQDGFQSLKFAGMEAPRGKDQNGEYNFLPSLFGDPDAFWYWVATAGIVGAIIILGLGFDGGSSSCLYTLAADTGDDGEVDDVSGLPIACLK